MYIEVTRDINATTDRVWPILVDVERWPTWTESMTSVRLLGEGPLALASKARVKQPRLLATTMTVSEFDPGKFFTWETPAFGGKILASHYLAPNANGGTTLRLVLESKGGLTALFDRFIGKLSIRYVNIEADGLKRESESRAAAAA